MDAFIQSSSKLLQAYPAATVSITYANMAKKKSGKVGEKSGNVAKESGKVAKTTDERRAKNVVKFKIYDSQSTKCLVYSTYKAKELSKILTFLGPRGVASSKRPVSAETEPKEAIGVASVMSNLEFKEPDVTVVEDKAIVEEKKDEGKKKKNKKKGRK